MNSIKVLNRRQFLTLTGVSGGSLILGCTPSLSNLNQQSKNTSDKSGGDLGVFVTIQADDQVDIICHRAEMGQGILSSVPQIIAEEMGADWSKVNAVLAASDTKYGDQSTAGSASIRIHYDHIRQMGVIAREMLLQAASNKWQLPKDQLVISNNQVRHEKTLKVSSFGELANDASKLPIPDISDMSFKEIKEYQIVGKDVQLQGLENIVTGKALYAQDVQLPGLLIASIERPPVVGGKVKSFDATEAKKVKGVFDVVQLKDRSFPVNTQPVSGVAVLADNTWAAIEGRKKLTIEWEHGENETHNSEPYIDDLIAKVQSKGKEMRVEGDVYSHNFNDKRTLEATYTVPYHHHMSMETPAATAFIDGNQVTVWSGTQNPQWGKSQVMAELGLDPVKDNDKVDFKMTLMGGAFGRKSKNDFTIEAVELAKATGRPVKVIWSREDDVKHGFYHSAAANYIKAEVNDEGHSDYWIQRVVSPPIGWIFDNTTTHLSANDMGLGFADIPFDISNLSCETPSVTTHVRTGWLRSVGNINNAFALGSFVDELADMSGINTPQMWLNLLGKDRTFKPAENGFKGYSNYGNKEKAIYDVQISRYKNTLKELMSKSGADQKTADNEGWGISLSNSFNSYAAAATKVKVVDGKVTVLEMHTAIDCGLVITPDRVRSQMEGAMIMGLSIALESEITVKDGAIVQNNFYDYPVSRMNQVPDLHVHLIDSQEAPGGVGEPGLPPILPSITNAIFHASGVRVRDLPVKKTLKV